MSSGFQATPREKTVLDDPKLKLYADQQTGGKGRPSLSLYYTSNNPRIDVYSNIPTDKDNGRIQAKISALVVSTMFTILEDLVKPETPVNTAYSFGNLEYTFDNNRQRSDEPKLKSKLIMGKDDAGRIYLSVLSWDNDRPKIKFMFGLDQFHTLAKIENGKQVPLSDGEISVLVAKGWLNQVRGLYNVVAVDQYKHKTPGDKGGSGNNNGGGGYNRNNSAPAPAASDGGFDDDLPF